MTNPEENRMNMHTACDPTDLITTDGSILEKKKFSLLQQRGFVWGPTVTAQWIILVNSAWTASHLPALPDVKAYLVHMLARTIGLSDLGAYRVGYLYYAREIADGRVDPALRQQLADVSLILAGLFPDTLGFRHSMLSRTHLISIGQTLYYQLSRKDDDAVFGMMAQHYMQAVMVLGHMRPPPTLLHPTSLRKNTPHVVFPRRNESHRITNEARRFGALLHTARGKA